MRKKIIYKDTVIVKEGPLKDRIGIVHKIYKSGDAIRPIGVMFTSYDESMDDTNLDTEYFYDNELILYQPQNEFIRPLLPGDEIYIKDKLAVWYNVDEVSAAGTVQIFKRYNQSLSTENQPAYLVEDHDIVLIAANIDIAKTNRAILLKDTKMKFQPRLPTL